MVLELRSHLVGGVVKKKSISTIYSALQEIASTELLQDVEALLISGYTISLVH